MSDGLFPDAASASCGTRYDAVVLGAPSIKLTDHHRMARPDRHHAAGA